MYIQNNQFSIKSQGIGYNGTLGYGNGWYRLLQCTSSSPSISGIQFKLHFSNMYMYNIPQPSSLVFTSPYDITKSNCYYEIQPNDKSNKVSKLRVVRDTATNAIYFDIKIEANYDNSSYADMWSFTLENLIFRTFKSTDGTNNHEPKISFVNVITNVGRDDTIPSGYSLLKEFELMYTQPYDSFIHIENYTTKDLNIVTAPGKYVCRGDVAAYGYSNTPVAKASTFTVYVISLLGTYNGKNESGNSYIKQILNYTDNSAIDTFMRVCIGGNWSSWIKVDTITL